MKNFRNVATLGIVAGAAVMAASANAWTYTTSAQWGSWFAPAKAAKRAIDEGRILPLSGK